MADFTPKLGRVPAPPAAKPLLTFTTIVLQTVASHRLSICLIGATHLLLSAILPRTVHLVLLTIVLITLISTHFKSRSLVIPGRATALIPHNGGAFTSRPIVVFNLGVQFNHPLSQFCPHGHEIALRFAALNADLMSRRSAVGLLGLSTWTGAGGALLAKYYFRDVAALNAFAHGEMHKEAWSWYRAAGADHIGIFHETFEVAPGAYETIYVNCKPVLLGAAAVEGEDGGGWCSTLVDADHVELRSQLQRLHRDADGNRHRET